MGSGVAAVCEAGGGNLLSLMKIILLKPMAVAGHPNAHVGDVLEVTANTFQILEGLGGARLVGDGAAVAPEVIETREPEIESRDPQPSETPHGKSSPRKRAK